MIRVPISIIKFMNGVHIATFLAFLLAVGGGVYITWINGNVYNAYGWSFAAYGFLFVAMEQAENALLKGHKLFAGMYIEALEKQITLTAMKDGTVFSTATPWTTKTDDGTPEAPTEETKE